MNTFTERLHEKTVVSGPEYHILSRTRKLQNHRKSRCISGYAGFSGLGGGCRGLHPHRAQQDGAGGVYEHDCVERLPFPALIRSQNDVKTIELTLKQPNYALDLVAVHKSPLWSLFMH